jgi:transposase
METPTLPDELRATLDPAVQAYITFLELQAASLQSQMSALQAEVAALRTQLAAAQARARQNSGNSSRPPSADPPDAPPRPRRNPTGRPRGAQAGHKGHTRNLLPAAAVDEIVEHRPTHCSRCQTALPVDLPDLAEPLRQQVWDIPPVVKPVVTEHRFHTVCCPACQTPVQAERPVAVPLGAFGPLVTALVGLLHGRYRLSTRETVALLLDLFRLPMALGSVPALCEEVSAAVAAPCEEAQAALSASSRANVDETSWKQAGQRRWLWVAVGVASTVFLVAATRSAAALTLLLGSAFGGIVGSDRFGAYRSVPKERRQVCWAHLKRNFTALAEWGGPTTVWGKEALALTERVFVAWHRFRTGDCDRSGLQAALRSVRAEIQTLLERGVALRSDKVQALARELLALWPALWTFVSVAGVEPTNNVAEQALRPAVLWRKGCFGAHSEAGNVFVQRILTVSATCRQQQRHLLTFLTVAVRAHRAGLPAPALVYTP